MKNSLNLAALLLGSAILFTSCTKEILQSPEMETLTQLQGTVVSSNSTLAKTIKAASFWTDCGGYSMKTTMPVSLDFSFTYISYTKWQEIKITAYRQSNDGILMQMLSKSSIKSGGSFMITAEPNVNYFVRLECGNTTCWVPAMPPDCPCIMKIPGTDITISVIVF